MSEKDLYDQVYNLLPLVAEGTLPVVKFTNLGNVFTDEKTIVIYCFPFGPSPKKARAILTHAIGEEGVVWGSNFFKPE